MLSLLCAVLVFMCSAKAQEALISAVPGKSVLKVESVNRTRLVYHLTVVQPEFPLENLATEFRSKNGISNCEVVSNGLLISTDPDMDKDLVMSVVKASGFRNTYKAYKLELRDALPKPEVRREIK